MWQVAVWHLQAGEVDDEVVDCHDVDVDEAVHIVALVVAVAVPVVQLLLDVVDDVQRLDGRVAALHGDSHVEEAIVALKAPGLALNNGGSCRHQPQVERQAQVGGPEVALAVVEIGAYVEIVSHHHCFLKERV